MFQLPPLDENRVYTSDEVREYARQAIHALVAPNHQVKVNELVIDLIACRVSYQGTRIRMSPAIYKLLAFFMLNPNRVHGREKILNTVWGYEKKVSERTVDVMVKRLRDVLPPEHAVMLTSVRSVGYIWSPR